MDSNQSWMDISKCGFTSTGAEATSVSSGGVAATDSWVSTTGTQISVGSSVQSWGRNTSSSEPKSLFPRQLGVRKCPVLRIKNICCWLPLILDWSSNGTFHPWHGINLYGYGAKLKAQKTRDSYHFRYDLQNVWYYMVLPVFVKY